MRSLASQTEDYIFALGTRAAADLPCTAQSLNRSEARFEAWAKAAWPLTLFALMAAIWIGVGWGRLAADQQLWFWAGLGLSGAVAGFFAWTYVDERRDYRDPEMSIEIDSEGVTFHSPRGTSRRLFHELPRPTLLFEGGDGSPSFTGISFHGPLGHVQLEDGCYGEGRAAAGAILKRLEELNLWQPGP